METFKPIDGYPWYLISDQGQVKSILSGKIRRFSVHREGYCSVALCHQDVGKPKHYYIHRLVAKAFCPNPLDLPDVNHIDGIKSNNWATNLEWITHKENHAHAVRLRGGVHWCKGLKSPKAMTAYVASNGTDSLEFQSVKAASEHFKMKYSTFAPMIARAAKNGWTAKGYYWARKTP